MSPPVCLLPLAVACSTAAWGLSQQVGEAERICLLGAWGGQRTQGSQFNFPCPNTAQLLLGASMRGCGSCINPKAEGVKAAKGPSAERSHMGECGEPTVMRLGSCFKLCKSFPMPPLHKVYKPQEYPKMSQVRQLVPIYRCGEPQPIEAIGPRSAAELGRCLVRCEARSKLQIIPCKKDSCLSWGELERLRQKAGVFAQRCGLSPSCSWGWRAQVEGTSGFLPSQ